MKLSDSGLLISVGVVVWKLIKNVKVYYWKKSQFPVLTFWIGALVVVLFLKILGATVVVFTVLGAPFWFWPSKGHEPEQYPQLSPIDSKFESTLVAHQNLPSKSSSFVQAVLNLKYESEKFELK